MGRIRIIGERDPRREETGPDLGLLADLPAVTVREVQAARVETTRAGSGPHLLDRLAPDTIVELTLEGGARVWMRYEQLAADLPSAHSRGAADEPDTIDLPLVLDGPLTRGGAGQAVIEAVRTFDLDLPGLTASALGGWFDERRMPEPGLRRWLRPIEHETQDKLTPADLVGDDPVLLFLHGTASSTDGSFGGLQQPALSAEEAWRAAAWSGLARAYGERIAAFEHRTLSVSPITNAIDLLHSLPENARLHLVSHSRGGMIGELLCRAQRTDGKTPFAGEIEALTRWVEDKGDGYRRELEKLVELERLLAAKRPRVERFVRVACPAAGTTLAGGRLDRWLSLVTNVLDLTGLGASLTYRCIKGFLLAVVKTRTDPRHVPGLEAMLPGSLLTAVLNRPGVETSADLSVIAGDVEGGPLLARLALWLADRFYGGSHDLVVDTVAMYGGLARKGGARYFFDQGDAVNHFGYFRSRRTIERLVAGLGRAEGEAAGFVALERPPEIDQRVYGRRAGTPRPAVFILPDLMGSHLARGAERIWINLDSIARGGLAELAIDRPDVHPSTLVADAYRGLIGQLEDAHEVLPFPYDWRRSLQVEGGRFADALADRLAALREPVRIVGHGMGGLVALVAFALRPQLWRDLAARPGCRLLMLGTPHRGSFAVARLLLGEERLTGYLALLDLDRGEAAQLEALAGFDGLLEMLPSGSTPDLLAPATWKRLRRVKPEGWTEPTEAALVAARATRALLDAAPIDPELMVYVAGTAPETAVGLEIEGERRVRFVGTTRGDGRVPWETGPPAGINPWWVEAEHGDLAGHAGAFAAYAELLETGTTRLLPRTPPAAARATSGLFELPPDGVPVFPDERELVAAALGFHQRPPRLQERKTQVRLVNGNLAFARWPVAVGHYTGDTLAGSEEHLDRALGGRLARRRDLGLYPDAVETVSLILDPGSSPPGAVVVGLGAAGELTPGKLRRSVARGLREYALARREAGQGAGGETGISILLIGAGEGGISIRDSVGAILDAVQQANAALGEDRLTEIELVELFEDRAIQAAHAIAVALDEARLAAHLEFGGEVQVGVGGRRRAAAEEDPSWWRRRQVKRDEQGGLRFTDLTDRARAEVSLVADQRLLVDRFIRRAVRHPIRTDAGDDPGATLFELMLPTRLKEEARNDRNLVLVLDKATAGYPWELLHDGGRGETKPPAVRAGLIRQLVEEHYPERPVMATGERALVVGDPPSGMREFPLLEGAKAEAERVAQLLGEGGRFAVTPRIRTDPESIVSALMDGRGWRVMHLAAHGEVDFPSHHGPVTGMVLGDGLFLTADTIRQLPMVPELVVLNCCHLGRTDATAERQAEGRHPELAANLATAFIKLGTRAVVAAGWAVDDAAARLFAETLYGRLLEGDTFGEAVLAARQDTFETFRRTNTWGAYQCYGDPAYRLVPDRAGERARRTPRPFAHLREAVIEIENIAQDAQTMAARDPQQLQGRLEHTLKRMPEAWRGRPEILSCLGEACGELNRLDEAIEHYSAAIACAASAAPIRCIEQLASLRARKALRDAARDRKAATSDIKAAIKTLRGLEALTGEPPTAERLSLLGGCYKRLAQVSSRERDEALAGMAEHYRDAYRRAEAEAGRNTSRGGRTDGRCLTYPLLNWLLADTLRAVRKGEPPPEAMRWLDRAEAAALQAGRSEPDFWSAITLADVMLGRQLARAEPGDERQQEAVVEAYLRPWRRGASPFKFATVLEQLEFVADVLADGPRSGKATRERLAGALRSIAERLRLATGVR